LLLTKTAKFNFYFIEAHFPLSNISKIQEAYFLCANKSNWS